MKSIFPWGGDLTAALQDLALQDFAARTKGKVVVRGRDSYWVASSVLRARFLKELGISESDNLYLKIFDKVKTEVHSISKLNFVIELNFAGDTHVASFGFEYSEGGSAIAMIGKENPFKDVVMKTLFSSKGIYHLDAQRTLEMKKDGKAFDMGTGKRNDSEFLEGDFTLNLRMGKKQEEIFKNELETDSYVTTLGVYAGDVLKDGSTLIFIKANDCGDFVKIYKDKTEKWKSLCGSWGC